MITVLCAALAAFFGCLTLWLIEDARQYRAENTALRREVARLSRHPSAHKLVHKPSRSITVIPGGRKPSWAAFEEPDGSVSGLPYMRRYADDE